MARYRSFHDPSVYVNTDLILKVVVKANQFMPGEGIHAITSDLRWVIEAQLVGGEVLVLAHFPAATDAILVEARLQQLLQELS